VRVELNHSNPSVLPAGFRLADNDNENPVGRTQPGRPEGQSVVPGQQGLAAADQGRAAIGLPAQEYRAELPPDSGWTGMAELEIGRAEMDHLYQTGTLESTAGC